MSTPTITATTISRAGQNLGTLAVAATGAGDVWAGTGKEFLYITNAGAGAITVTLNFGTGGSPDGQAAPAKTVSVGNGVSMLIGPFPVNFYNDATGNVVINYSGVTSVKILVCILGN